MIMIKRVGWYRSDKKWPKRTLSDIKYLTIHHSAIKKGGTDSKILKTMQKYHELKDWPGLSYHCIITPNGKIYQINAYTDITWHDRINKDSIGILVYGYFHRPYNENPTTKQLLSLKWLLNKLRKEFNIPFLNIVGHRERSPTKCPGDNLNNYIEEYKLKKGNVDWNNLINLSQSNSNQLNILKYSPKKLLALLKIG